ncbi:MAG TPA: MMPL family transporter [Gemmatimonadaceae bacterium]|nr:MMPL family transporter [Gemmatimonadaceae bacterium]
MRALIRFAIQRPKLIIALWAVPLAAAAPFASRLAGALRGSTDAVPGSPSEVVSRYVNEAFGEGSAFVFPVVVTSSSVAATDPQFAAAAVRLERVLDFAGMSGVRHYWNTRDQSLLGRDGRSALLLVRPRAGTFFDAESAVEEIRAAARGSGVDSTFAVKVTGMVSLFHDLDVNASDDLLRAERIGIPLTLVVLLLVFGAPIAAGLPLILALGTIVITLAVLFALSRVMPVSIFAQNAVTMVGLGIGVDYALFLVSRYREELRRNASFRGAAETAANHAAHVVLVSGFAVCTGFLALFLVNIRFLHTLALGGVAVVVTSVLMTLTLLPSLLVLIGEKLNWPRRLSQRPRADSGLWGRWAQQTMSKPWRYLVPATVVLAVLIAPILRLRTWNMGARDLSSSMEARQGYELLERNFAAGWMGPIAILVKSRDSATVWTEQRESVMNAIYSRLASDSRAHFVGGFPHLVALLGPSKALVRDRADLQEPLRTMSEQVVSRDGRSALIFIVPRSAPESEEVMTLVRELRADSWASARNSGLEVQVGGFSASILDFDAELMGSLERVIPIVLAITFIALMVAFRSIVVPIKAITMNLISVLAAYGFLVYVFQDGIGAGFIGLIPPGGLNSFIVLMLFTILFGLSMDYEVFLLSRIKEEYERTGDNSASVVNGLGQTGGLITSAALIMVVLFGSFGFTRLTATREFGLGLAFAVALDATLIRVVLVPTLMGLLGRANWWFPGTPGRRERTVPKTILPGAVGS